MWEARQPHTFAGLPLPSPSQRAGRETEPQEDGFVLGHSGGEPKTKVCPCHVVIQKPTRTDTPMGQVIEISPPGMA